MFKSINIIKEDIHILLIGPVTNAKANLIGGATISFGYLLNYLDSTKEAYTLINTQKFPNGLARLLNPFYVLFKVIANYSIADVLFLNSSRKGTQFLAPILAIIAHWSDKKFVFRPFGGNIKEYTGEYNQLQKWIFDWTILKTNIFFLQTKALLQFYANRNINTQHLPTSRDQPSLEYLRENRPFAKKFIYLGFVNEAKGIRHILEASKKLDDSYTIHVFGPVQEPYYSNHAKALEGIYQGLLNKDEVLKTLQNYDVLMLPTFYDGEGYPGALIEAYSIGLPVISTHWKSIPEIVKDGETGRLINIKSTNALVEAIEYFNNSNYQKYSEKARAYFLENFETETVTKKVINQIKALF